VVLNSKIPDPSDFCSDIAANLEETKPFYQVYEHGLINDAEFAFLEQSHDSRDRDIVMGDEDQGDDDNESPETVTPAEIRQRAREFAEQRQVGINFPLCFPFIIDIFDAIG
jgi:hypothetical protein